MSLPLTGYTLSAYNNLPAIPPQEPLGDLLNSIGSSGGSLGQAVTTDAVLTPTGVTLSATVTSTGIYKVSYMATILVVGGSGADGYAVSSDNSGGFVMDPTNYVGLRYSPALTVGYVVTPSTVPTYIFSDLASSLYTLEGFINVTTVGTFGLRAYKFGNPTSATLLKGSGLILTKVL